jgi:hypothetical protein
MNPGLEIIIPVRNPDGALAQSVVSLVAQTNREFGVVLCDNFSSAGLAGVENVVKQLGSAGIAVRRVKPPIELKPIEHWNWAHSQGQADWLKPLAPGAQLKPAYVETLKQRIAQQPKAQLIRCEIESMTGNNAARAPFSQASVTPVEFLNYFPTHVRWMDGCANVAYGRAAWLAVGGYSPQFPCRAALNLNVILALHYGLENTSERLVALGTLREFTLNEAGGQRVNQWLELWLVLRQARNYCLAGKLPWSKEWLLPMALAASMGRG